MGDTVGLRKDCTRRVTSSATPYTSLKTSAQCRMRLVSTVFRGVQQIRQYDAHVCCVSDGFTPRHAFEAITKMCRGR